MAESSVENVVFEDLVKEFCEVTQCPPDVGKRFIEINEYNLESSAADAQNFNVVDLSTTTSDKSKSVVKENAILKMITWNIDGLDEKDLKLRTLAVTFQINSLQPEIVYLQEVVPETLELIKKMCKGYTVHHHVRVGYFCAILIRKITSLQFVSKKILEYPGSIMGRYLLCINIKYNDCPVLLLNTHLESTKDAATQRKVQLKACFEEIEIAAQDNAVILAGDLNIRDEEIKSIGGLPDEVLDAWVETGGNYSEKFTWDVSANDNLNWQYKSKPKLRFDRVLYKSGKNRKLQVKSFNLIGKDRLESCGRFASDHWGIQCHFTVNYSQEN